MSKKNCEGNIDCENDNDNNVKIIKNGVIQKKILNDKEDNIDQDKEDEDEDEYENKECNICSKCRCNKRR